jgi:acetate---CoA ligase (ADP-forming)
MTADTSAQRLARGPSAPQDRSLLAMLEARSVALVGASRRPGSFGSRMLAEAVKSTARPAVYPVNPRYQDIEGLRCYASLADLPEPADLVLLGVPDAALEEQLRLAARLGSPSAVIFGNAHEDAPRRVPGPAPDPAADSVRLEKTPLGSPLTATRHPQGGERISPSSGGPGPGNLRQRLASIALSAGMELCGAGCMGFANVGHGLRAMGYVEPDPLPAGPVALVTHSGSVFSTLLRTRRGFGFTLAVSSGQELVTAAPSYLSYALAQPETKVLALVLEAMRQPDRLRQVLAIAAERDMPVVLLTAGQSASGRAMVAAHSGALAGADGAWEALARAYGVHRVADLAELADTVELFSLLLTRRRGLINTKVPSTSTEHHQSAVGAERPEPVRGIASVHDSGLERAHLVDIADELGVPLAAISEATKTRLAGLLDPGLIPENPLDVWGTGAGTRELFAASLNTLADDDAVDAVALAVDLVPELDGDASYRLAMLDVAAHTGKPAVVISNLASAIDRDAAVLLRGRGIPVLEGMRPGLLALRHLLDHSGRGPTRVPVPGGHAARIVNAARAGRAMALLARSGETGAAQLALLAEYGIATARAERVTGRGAAAAAARRIGYPVVLKTDEPGVAHKSDAGGVVLGIRDEAELLKCYADLASRLGPAALVCESVPPSTELALGLVKDPDLGPLVIVGAGGTLVEVIADRVVAMPPLTPEQATDLLGGLKVARLLAGVRGARPADIGAVARAIACLAELAGELGEHIEALDINPLICGPDGAVAVDALVVRAK